MVQTKWIREAEISNLNFLRKITRLDWDEEIMYRIGGMVHRYHDWGTEISRVNNKGVWKFWDGVFSMRRHLVPKVKIISTRWIQTPLFRTSNTPFLRNWNYVEEESPSNRPLCRLWRLKISRGILCHEIKKLFHGGIFLQYFWRTLEQFMAVFHTTSTVHVPRDKKPGAWCSKTYDKR